MAATPVPAILEEAESLYNWRRPEPPEPAHDGYPSKRP